MQPSDRVRLARNLRIIMYPHVEKCILYGSAIGSSYDRQDVDIMIVAKQEMHSKVWHDIGNIIHNTGIMLHPIVISVKEYNANHMYATIAAVGVDLFDLERYLTSKGLVAHAPRASATLC